MYLVHKKSVKCDWCDLNYICISYTNTPKNVCRCSNLGHITSFKTL